MELLYSKVYSLENCKKPYESHLVMSMNSMAVKPDCSICYNRSHRTVTVILYPFVFLEKKMTALLYISLQLGSTTATTLDLIHKQEITHGAGGAAVCSLNLRVHPHLCRSMPNCFHSFNFPLFFL